MRVNTDLIRRMRKDRAWSQDELAAAAGLNLRTVQRIEKEATASLQSVKALAAAFDADVRDFEDEEYSMLNELLGKDVMIVMGPTTGLSRNPDDVNGKIVEMDDNWLKLLEKNKTVLVSISQIKRIIVTG